MLGLCGLALALDVLVPAETAAPAAAAPGPGNEDAILVAGSPVGSITASPALSPAFSQATHDYVVHCQSGANQVTFTLTASSGTIQVGQQSGATVTVTRSLAENQPEIVQAPDPSNPAGPPTQYWIRCLPHDFPVITASPSGAGPSPGYYLTGTVTTTQTTGLYAMILDANGTPVWYQPAPAGAANTELLPNDTLAWSPINGPGVGAYPNDGYQLFQLDSETTRQQASPVQPSDPHELLQLPNGDRMEFATPLRTCPGCLPPFPSFSGNTFVDCIVQQVDPAGNLVWSWDAFDHVSPKENTIPNVVSYNGQSVADPYHCNSIDVDPTAADPRTGDVLISQRDTSAVYRINRSNTAVANGRIIWKLGGTSPNQDGATVLSLRNDSETTISGQHDARFQGNGDVSLYDDHTSTTPSAAARAVQYHIDTSGATATLDWSVASPDGQPASATGSFRRYAGGADNIIGWGFKGNPSMSDVDSAGNPLLTFTFTPGAFEYRFLKIPLTSINLNLLRMTAGTPRPVPAALTAHLGGLDGPQRGNSAIELSDSSMWLEKNLGNGTFGPPQVGATNGPFYGNVGTYLADIDGTGQASAIAVNTSSIWVEHDQGDDTFGPPALAAANGPFYGNVATYLAGIDGTGKASAIAVNTDSIWVEHNLGNDTFGPPQAAAGSVPFYGDVGTYLADIDGTGKASAIAVNTNNVWVEHNLGNDTFGPPQLAASHGPFYGSVGTFLADIDGTGKASAIAVNPNNVWVERNLGNDTLGPPQLAADNGPFYGTR